MTPWLGVAYGAVARTAELLTLVTPSGTPGKVGRGFVARRGIRQRYRAWGAEGRDRSRPLLWVHAASVGEGLMALPLLQGVRRALPNVQIAYTFFSPSAESLATQMGADFSDYLPFDSASSARIALDALDPTALVFTKGDVWPALVRAAAAQNVRLALVSASIPASSLRTSTIGMMLTRDAYRALDAVGAASADDAKRIVAAGARADRVRVTGDTRYDQAWTRARVEPRNVETVAALQSTRPTLVAGSTWRSDERELFPAWLGLRDAVPTARLVIAPHELTRGHATSIEEWARSNSLSTAPLGAATTDTDVVVVDRMGVLADIYAVATVAYVGGGFHDAGLHSLVEPAVFRVPVLVGPRHADSRDASLMLSAGGVISTDGTAQLTRAMVRLMTDERERADRSDAIGTVVAAELGAVDRSFGIVRELLRPM
ncbi:MAG TPA: glycosyltransferase N-terminal domain-containing protein [Gemmatimonadaceae bacterium]